MHTLYKLITDNVHKMQLMFDIFLLLFVSTLSGCLSQSSGNCPSEIGFLDSSSFNPNSNHYFFYFYSGVEANGSSNRFIFPNLTVPCYVNVKKIELFQGLPYACFDARARYVFDLWSLDPDTPGKYELVYSETLKNTDTNVSTRILLYPSTDLIMYPGDIIGFRDAALNFFSSYNIVEPKKVTPTYWGIIQPSTSCRTFSILELDTDVYFEGNWAPSLNFSLAPQSPITTEFQIRYYWNQNESIQSIQLYHRGIYKPICNHFWHIRTADILCQMANFSHAVYADTRLTYDSSSQTDTGVSDYYWLDYLYCPMYVVESHKCLRSSWECVSNCSTYSQTAASSCAMEEGRTRFVLREIYANSTNQSNFDTLTQFSSDFAGRRVPIVQIYYKQHWQDLSGDDLLQSTVEVICKSHGFTHVFFIGKFETNNSSQDRILLNCTGSESSTSECSFEEYSVNTTSNYLPILVCSYEDGHISLYNNQSHSRAKGEVQYAINSSSLAFVCTDNWSAIESSVVCSQLGYPTLLNYSIVPANQTDQSQYNYYWQIDTFHIIEANFECSGYESSLRDCGISRLSTNSTVCQKNVVKIACEPDQLIHNRTIDCYNYIEFLQPSLNYEFKNEHSSNCFSLYNLLSLTNNIKSTRTGNYFIQSFSFARTISMHSNFIKLSSTTDIRKRSVNNTEDLCFVIYFDSSGAPLSVAGITNSTTLTYSTLYHLTSYPDAIHLTGNITNLHEPVNTTSMSLVCDRAGTSISKAYLIGSHSEPSITTDTPSFIGNFMSLQELETAYKSVITPTTPPITTTINNSTTIPNSLAFMYTGIATGVIVLLSIIVSIFICLLHILRRHYKNEIVTLQIQSKSVVSSVYQAENCDNNHFLNISSHSTNNYVQQNVFYYKLKLKSNLFVESTKSIRHTMLTVSIVPKFGVKMPEVNYVDVNSKRNSDTIDQWHLERDKLVYLRELGLGYYGKVQLMEAKNMYGHDKLPVAVKTLSTQDRQQTEQFMREVKLMMSLQNEYVVSLLGFCPPTKDATPLMVLEYMEFGDLKSLIRSYQDTPATRERELNILHLVSMAHNIASALVYLAEHFYVHRDIAARNCLVGKGLICKLSDFGLTLMTDGQSSNSLPRVNTTVPVKWTAPETFLSGVFSFSSDVWSYGVFLWEIFSYGAEPLEDLTKAELISAVKSGTLALPHITNVPGFCNDLIQMCCFFDHLQRPYIQDVKSIIEGVLFQNDSEDSNSVHSCIDDVTSLVETTV